MPCGVHSPTARRIPVSLKWRLSGQAAALFSRGNGVKKGTEHDADDLHRVIGQLTVARGF